MNWIAVTAIAIGALIILSPIIGTLIWMERDFEGWSRARWKGTPLDYDLDEHP